MSHEAKSSAPAPDLRQSLKTLLEGIFADPAASFGYASKEILFGKDIRITVEKAGGSLVVWLRPANESDKFYKRTAGLKIGYSGVAPDAQAYQLLETLYNRLARWERTQRVDDLPGLFRQESPGAVGVVASVDAPVDPVAASLLAPATLTPIYTDWLVEREQLLTAGFKQIQTGVRKVLLVNATMGLQFYPSITDYFARMQRVRPEIQVICASYFEQIEELSVHVANKGLSVAPIAEVMTWTVEAYNRFDVVLLIGPSDILAALMKMEGLTARLVLLDLAFYHQLLDQHAARFLKNECLVPDQSAQRNKVVCYSCQTASKAQKDLAVLCSLSLIEWRWFNYIPIGFAYGHYYRSDQHPFDVALLGSSDRDYTQINPDLFRGVRFLFLGSLESAPVIRELREKLDITVVSKVDPDIYARLVALCRCVALPLVRPTPILPGGMNVLVSLLDTVASGKGLVIPWHEAVDRLAHEDLPAIFYAHTTPDDIFHQVDGFLHDTERQRKIEARSIEFAKKQLDIYRILGVILNEQILG